MKLKTLITAAVLSSTLMVQASDLKEIDKDMRIMKRIIETSLSDGNRYSNRVEATYLARQGMVFTIHSGGVLPIPNFDGDWESWGEAMGASALSYVQEAIPAMAPVLPPEALAEMEAEVAEGMAELYSNSSETSEKFREELAEMRERLRRNKEQYRDNLRELRQIEREKYHAEEKRRKELDQKRTELEKRIAENKKVMESYTQKMDEYRKERLEKHQKKKSQLVNETIVALCDYRASLRALDKNEHVTLIFDNFGDKRGQDKIYVFKKSDIADCESSNKGIERLITDAVVYSQ